MTEEFIKALERHTRAVVAVVMMDRADFRPNDPVQNQEREMRLWELREAESELMRVGKEIK